MTELELIDLVERFQTIIVGSIGLLGVNWTLHTNAKNAKSEHQRSLDTRRSTLRKILAAEFRNYSQALRGNLKKGPPDDTEFSIGRIRQTLFESLSTDMGLLEPDEIDVIVNAIISF